MLKGRRFGWTVAIGLAITVTTAGAPALGATGPGGFSPRPTYQANDYAHGQAMFILPAGENGLVNAAQLARFEKNGTRPPHSQDQLAPYENLEFGYRSLTDSTLHNYYLGESFGVPGQIISTEHPSPKVPVVIYRDQHDIPHIYGKTDAALAFGAGYAQAQDRLFLMDVLRHYGAGTLTSFLGPSCADEQMDHDELLLAPYPTAQANAQVNALPAEYGAQGRLAVQMIREYVQGINAYITKALTDPALLPVEYPLLHLLLKPWTPADVVGVAGLIGGIFGDGGGGEIRNAALLRYLQGQLGRSAGSTAFGDFKEQNDPAAPTSVVGKSFPYEIPGHVNPATIAIPDNPSAPLKGGPVDTTPGCSATPPSKAGLSVI